MTGLQGRFVTLLLVPLLCGSITVAVAQERVRIGARVSYISGLTAYLAAGRESGLAAGDSAIVVRGKRPGVLLLVTAVSGSSASTRPVGDTLWAEIGDSVVVEKTGPPAPQPVARPSAVPGTIPSAFPGGITGSAAVQFAAASQSDGGWTFVQPALILRLTVPELVGHFDLNLQGRSTYDLGPDLGRFPGDRRYRTRMYDFSLVMDDPSSPYGVGFGRFVSRYMGGMGAFDGAELVVRQGNFAAGILGGFQPDYITSGLSGDYPKFAGFVSYQAGSGYIVPAAVTLAYGQQMFRGKLDRDFLYVQSTFNLGPRFFLTQSTELDLHRSENGVRVQALQLTNTYVSLSSQVLDWLGATLGYDATRPVFLLESMKAIPDTLFDRDLYQGFRGGITLRLPVGILLMGEGSIRSKPDGSRTARSAGGSVRVMDVGGSRINVGARYSRNIGVFAAGNETGIDVDRWFAGGLSVSLHASRYVYELQGLDGRTAATTVGGSVSWAAYRSWYLMGSLDRTIDPLRGSSRVLLEIGRRF